jgi:hypothetical protein
MPAKLCRLHSMAKDAYVVAGGHALWLFFMFEDAILTNRELRNDRRTRDLLNGRSAKSGLGT